MAVADTSNSPEADTVPVRKHPFLTPGAPHPKYSITDGFAKKADLVLYRKSGVGRQYFQPDESKKRARPSASAEPAPEKTTKSPWVGKTAWNFIETFIEVKTDPDMRAFEMEAPKPSKVGKTNTKVKNTLPDTIESRKTRGQLAQYAGQIMLRQHRCFVYSIFILRSRARLIYWDRSGAVVSPSFDIVDDSEKFLHFIYALGCADSAHLGHDPSAKPVDILGKDEEKWVAAAQSIKTTDPELYARVEEAGANSWPKYKLQVPGDNAKTSAERWEAAKNGTVPPERPPAREFLVAKHSYGHRSPTGRGCRGYVALDISSKTPTFRFLKDFWRTTLPDYPPESVAYRMLEKASVPQVLTFLCGGDITEEPNVTIPNPQSSIAHKYDERKDGDKLHDTYQHGRLVLEQVGRELKDYKDSQEMVRVLRDALTGTRF